MAFPLSHPNAPGALGRTMEYTGVQHDDGASPLMRYTGTSEEMDGRYHLLCTTWILWVFFLLHAASPLATAMMYTSLSLRQCCVHCLLLVCIVSISKFSRFDFIFVFKKKKGRKTLEISLLLFKHLTQYQ